MNKIIIVMSLLFISATCSTKKYSAPNVESCMVLNTVDNDNRTEVATCFCVNKNLTRDNFQSFISRVENQMSNHYLANETVQFVKDNMKNIIALKEYEMPIQYCRGYQSLGPDEQKNLEIWAEDNRIERIKCEAR